MVWTAVATRKTITVMAARDTTSPRVEETHIQAMNEEKQMAKAASKTNAYRA